MAVLFIVYMLQLEFLMYFETNNNAGLSSQEIISRLGRWIDFDNDYKSMYPWYMESIWWVFKQLYNKGLVYKGYKVQPDS